MLALIVFSTVLGGPLTKFLLGTGLTVVPVTAVNCLGWLRISVTDWSVTRALFRIVPAMYASSCGSLPASANVAATSASYSVSDLGLPSYSSAAALPSFVVALNLVGTSLNVEPAGVGGPISPAPADEPFSV